MQLPFFLTGIKLCLTGKVTLFTGIIALLTGIVHDSSEGQDFSCEQDNDSRKEYVNSREQEDFLKRS